MARAGASIVQVYTVFGYRGVGTPRLLKDELKTSLRGGTWKGEVGKDWKGKGGEMGWDPKAEEERLNRGSEDLRREARGLGDMWRGLNEDGESSMGRLVREAERALGKSGPGFEGSSQSHSQEIAGEGVAGGGGIEGTAPRDNLLGANAEPIRPESLTDTPTPPEIRAIEGQAVSELEAMTTRRREVASSVGEAMRSEGREVDLRGYIVPVHDTIAGSDSESDTTLEDFRSREVGGGERRLV